MLSSPLSPSHGVDARSSEGEAHSSFQARAFQRLVQHLPQTHALPQCPHNHCELRVHHSLHCPLLRRLLPLSLTLVVHLQIHRPRLLRVPPLGSKSATFATLVTSANAAASNASRHPSCLVTEVTLQFRDDDMRDDDVRDGDEHGDEDDAHRWFDVDSNASGAVPNFDKDNGNKLVSVYVSGKVYLKREQDHGWRAKTLAPGATYYFRVIFASDELVSHEDIALGAATENVHGLKKVKGKPSDACPVTLPILFAPEAPRIEIEVVPDKEERWKLKLKWQPRTKRIARSSQRTTKRCSCWRGTNPLWISGRLD